MKLTIFFLTLFLQVSATSLSQTITLSVRNTKIEDVFSSVKKQAGYVFFYSKKILSEIGPVSIEAKNMDLNDFLNELFKDKPIKFSIKKKAIIIGAAVNTQTINITATNAPIGSVFKEIRKQTGFVFMASDAVLKLTRPVTIDAKNMELKTLLDLIFRDQPITYSIKEYVIIVVAKPKDNGTVVKKEEKELTASIDVHGRVTNERGEPVAGVTVMVKGTKLGTSTNENGEFTITGVDENATIVFSGISIEPYETKLNGRTELAYTARTRSKGLEEIVINKGYYTTTEKLNTGSVAVVKSKEVERQPVTNPLLAMQGRVAGVYITQTSGNPGAAINIQIRGQNSLRNDLYDNGNLPLYVVDGVPYSDKAPESNISTFHSILGGSPLNFINTNDIESIEVLKDADATSLYGSRGANGVVLITTKSGKFSSNKTSVDYYYGIGSPGNRIKMLDRDQYVAMRLEAIKNDGGTPQPSDDDVNGQWANNATTDWQNYLFGKHSTYQSLSLAYTGGREGSRISVAGRYYRETTLLDKSQGTKTATLKTAYNFKDKANKFNGILSLQFNHVNNNINSYDVAKLITYAPNSPAIFNADGTLNWSVTWPGNANPFGPLQQTYDNNIAAIVSNALFEYKLLPALKLKLNLGYTNNFSKSNYFNPISGQNPIFNPTGSAFFSNTSIESYIIEPSASYEQKIARGKLNLHLSSTLQKEVYDASDVMGYGFTNDELLKNIAFAAGINSFPVNYYDYRYTGIRLAANYVYDNKYIINATGSRDGSSRFNTNQQFGNFWSVAGAWIFTEEEFLKHRTNFLSFGKIRSSYGISGSDKIPPYGYLSSYGAPVTQYNSSFTLFPTRIGNEGYTWESSKKFEIALELGLLKEKLKFTGAYYHNESSNQLVGYTLAPTAGFASVQANLEAIVANWGYELGLQSVNMKTKDFQWNTSFNISFPKNKLVAFDNLKGSSYANTYVVGEPLSVKKLYHYTGVDPQTGLYTFEDVNKDGLYNNDDKRPVFSGVKFQGGVANSISWKKFDLDFNFFFVKQRGYNYLSYAVSSAGTFNINYPVQVLSRWQKPGDITDVQRFGTGPDVSNAFYMAVQSDAQIADASFIKLKNLALSYNVSNGFLSRLRVTNARIYLQGQNIVTFTNYPGLDPESLNFTQLPALRILTAGVQLTF